jgi:hypothetical protein
MLIARNVIRSMVRYAVATAACFACAAAGDPPVAPALLGNYEMRYRGALAGDGNAVVGANSVLVRGRVRDSAGNVGNLVAPNLILDRLAFSGTGSWQGQTVEVSGRIDLPAGVLKAPRVVCTITVIPGKHGRAVGFKR